MENLKEVRIGDLKKFKLVRYVWTPNRELIKKEIVENGFDNNNHRLILTNDYYVLDGNHRLEILENNFDHDYKVKVEIKNMSVRTLTILMFLFTILFLPIVIFNFLKLEYKIIKNRIPNEFKIYRKRNT